MKTRGTGWIAGAIVGTLLACSSAHASLIRFEYVGSVARTSAGIAPRVDPAAVIRWSFTINTDAVDPTSPYPAEYTVGDGAQLTRFFLPFLVSDFSLKADDRNLLSFDGPAPGGVFAGSLPYPGAYDGVLHFSDGGHTMHYDTGATIPVLTAEEFFAAPDPFETLLLSIQSTFDQGRRFTINHITGEWGDFSTADVSISVYRVPEPDSVLLLFAGLLLTIFARRNPCRSYKIVLEPGEDGTQRVRYIARPAGPRARSSVG